MASHLLDFEMCFCHQLSVLSVWRAPFFDEGKAGIWISSVSLKMSERVFDLMTLRPSVRACFESVWEVSVCEKRTIVFFFRSDNTGSIDRYAFVSVLSSSDTPDRSSTRYCQHLISSLPRNHQLYMKHALVYWAVGSETQFISSFLQKTTKTWEYILNHFFCF